MVEAGPSAQDQKLLEGTFRRAVSAATTRERIAELVILLGFVAASGALVAIHPPSTFNVLPMLACMLVLAIAARVWFETPLGFTAPTQLAFVPLLFATPLGLVAPAVAVALMVSRTPEVLRGRTKIERLLFTPSNAWFAVGAVAVFLIAGAAPRHAAPLVLALALLGQFGADSACFTTRAMMERNVGLKSQLSSTWVYVVDAALAGIGLVVARQMEHSVAGLLALLPLLAIFAFFARERHGRLANLLELSSAYRGTALVLGDVVEADDGYTGEHSKSVVQLAVEVADRLALDADHCRNVEFGALLHDVGKIAIPKGILNKPGKLDPDEWTIIQTHTLEGQKMLERVGGFMREVGQIVRSHHERWDGGGYPDGLAGEAIPLESRIIACCDTWSAMRTDRVYRAALSYEAAVAELRSVSGTQLDPAVVTALLDVVKVDAPDSPLEWNAIGVEPKAKAADPAPGASHASEVPAGPPTTFST